MAILKEIRENLKMISKIETITRIYQEIANLRMNKIRQRVLDNREFIEELSRLYTVAKKSYIAQLKKIHLRKEGGLRKAKKRVVVFLSANERFYGTLILDIWREILNYLAVKDAVLAVVGRMGKYLAERGGFGHKMFYFELDDDNPENWQIKGIIDFLKNYEEIIVFHGRFQTILSQKVAQSNISGGVSLDSYPPSTQPQKELATIKSYLFEPSPEAVLEFFETELISAFFNQAILEHQLSRYATRMMAMYQASENAKERKKRLEIEEKKLKSQLFNKKQIELFLGVPLWK